MDLRNEVDQAKRLNELISSKNITKNRKLADDLLKTQNQTQWLELRRRAKLDLYFLSKGILKYKKLSPNLHGSLCSWFDRNRSERFKEILLARGHYKSTVITESHSVQIVLPFDDEISNLIVWPENLNTNCKVLIAHELKATAQSFLSAITGQFLSNPLLMGLFPECIPDPKLHKINLSELELPRSEIHKEPTFSTMGVGARSQGYHFNYLKLDDLIGDKARDSKTEMKASKDWIDNIQSFFTAFTQDHMDIIGTRWAFDDLYDHIHKTYGSAILKYIRGAEEIVKDNNGNPILDSDGNKVIGPVFPEQFSMESFRQIKLNKRVWSAQYANNPSSGGTLFEHHWKRFYTWVNEGRLLKINKVNKHVSELDIVILIDPAMVGKAGFIVTGMDSVGNVIILEAIKGEWRPPELVDLIFNSVEKWKPRLVAIEKVLFSGLFEHWLKDAMRLRGVFFRVEPITTGNKEKESRVLGLMNYYASGQIFYHASQLDLLTEHDEFGATDDYHLLDALAQGPLVWRRGYNKINKQAAEDSYNLVMNSNNKPDPIGGY